MHLESAGVQVGNEGGNTIIGGSGSDIIIGDQGLTPAEQTEVTYNISLALDTSGSMKESLGNGQTRMQASVKALKNLVDSIAEQSGKDGLTVNIQLVGFSNEAKDSGWITLTQNNVDDLKAYLATLAATPFGEANYEAAFEKVLAAFQALPESRGEVHNSVYFISDDNPNLLMINGKSVG